MNQRAPCGKLPTSLAIRGQEYELLGELGEGGSARVFLVQQPGSAERLVLKVARSAEYLPHFQNEVRRHVMARCPELVPPLDAGHSLVQPKAIEGATGPWLLFPWVAGQTLRRVFKRTPMETGEVLRWVWSVGRALDELHQHGLSHGDVKPENIMLSGDSRAASSTELETENPQTGDQPFARLLDLGLAGDAGHRLPIGGTPRYLGKRLSFGQSFKLARARDLLGLTLCVAESVDPELIGRQDPWANIDPSRMPDAVRELVRPLLEDSSVNLLSGGWVAERAGQLLGLTESTESRQAFRRRRARAAYLKARHAELYGEWFADPSSFKSKIEAEWVQELLRGRELALALSASRTPDNSRASERGKLHPLDKAGLMAFLVHLIGPQASQWPLGLVGEPAEVIDRIFELLEHVEPAQLIFGMLQTKGQGSVARPQPGNWAADPEQELVWLASGLADPAGAPAMVARAEQLVLERRHQGHLLEITAKRLRLLGAYGRALVLLNLGESPRLQVLAAETYRRAHESARALTLIAELKKHEEALLPQDHVALSATQARILLDRGEPETALKALSEGCDASAPLLSPFWEVRAQIEASLGRLDDAQVSAERALAMASDDEERARADAVLGLVAHARGNASVELECYARAQEHAARAGAVIEEAHYLTGVAASAVHLGGYDLAQKSAARAVLLFDWAGRPAYAARARLAESAVYLALGAGELARKSALDAERRAKLAGDRHCRAYAHLTLAELLPVSKEGLEHVERAEQLLGELADSADELRFATRRLQHGGDVDEAQFDRLARASKVMEAAVEWWHARGHACLTRRDLRGARRVVVEVLALEAARAPLALLGATMSLGAELAAELGDGESARRLAASAREAARKILAETSAELRESVELLPWVKKSQASIRGQGLLPEQLAEVETLIRGLGSRENPRRMLERILDMLVLWTGVERALLLLPAPSGRLMVRAARNLARADLGGPQLELSRSLAMRALEQGGPVVAVDAITDLAESYASVHSLKLRSVLAMPLMAHGEKLGVVYLDDRTKRGAFGAEELGWVRVIASLASVAIADMRANVLLRRSARRATRAEGRLRELLSRREADLDLAKEELSRLRQGRNTRYGYEALVGESAPILSMLKVMDRVSSSEIPVLVLGESGSGKELVARALHENSPRSRGPFVSENCSAIPEGLLESALFGHVRGAFTGAVTTRSGLFEAADGGTLFLDEIGEMSPAMQSKLLRVLEDKVVRPLGSERGRTVNVRVIAATHRDLQERVRSGKFREDLFYRLNVVTIRVPPLRERQGDIALLARHFIGLCSPERPRRLSRGAEAALVSYEWPGNVRQLQNEIRRALVMADDVIEVEHLSPELVGAVLPEVSALGSVNLKVRVSALERQLLALALERADNNQTRAAAMLGVSRFGLQKMMKRLDIDRDTIKIEKAQRS